MTKSQRPPANGFVAVARKLYNPIGFSKGYNFVLFFIFVGALMGFSLARMQYLSVWGRFCNFQPGMPSGAGPGECYFFQQGHERVGIAIHLVTVIPASFLVCFQFVPAIRHKAILFHRINGYAIVVLSLVSTVGAFMVLRHSFGGRVETQTGLGLAGLMFIASLALAYYNIKRLQIEQHRAWMLRAWFYAGSIITLRLIMAISSIIISSQGQYFDARSCAQLDFILRGRNRTLTAFPDCAVFYSGQDVNKFVAVPANLGGGSSATAASALGSTFGSAAWLALALHAIGVEVYLRLTPAEAERLRNVSYQRQLEAGFKNPGRAGLTADRLGDSDKWTCSSDSADDMSMGHGSGGGERK